MRSSHLRKRAQRSPSNQKPGGYEVASKTDDRGRAVDIHALRHTFGTHLCRAGIPLRTAQAEIRHSDPSLTANAYTDPRLLDVAGAVEKLTALGAPAKNFQRGDLAGSPSES